MQLNSSGSAFVLLNEHKWKFKVFSLHSFYFRTPLASKSLYCQYYLYLFVFCIIVLLFIVLGTFLLGDTGYYCCSQRRRRRNGALCLHSKSNQDTGLLSFFSNQDTGAAACYLPLPLISPSVEGVSLKLTAQNILKAYRHIFQVVVFTESILVRRR